VASAAGAAKAAKQAEEAAKAAAAAAMATSCKPAEEVHAEVKEEIAQAAVEEPPPSPGMASPFEVASPEAAPDAVSSEAADQVSDTLPTVGSRKPGSLAGKGSFKLTASKSLRRMPSVNRRDSLVAVGSGAVSVADIHHLEDEVDVVVDDE